MHVQDASVPFDTELFFLPLESQWCAVAVDCPFPLDVSDTWEIRSMYGGTLSKDDLFTILKKRSLPVVPQRRRGVLEEPVVQRVSVPIRILEITSDGNVGLFQLRGHAHLVV